MLNWRLLGNPFNWVTVVVVLTMAAIFFDLLEQQISPSAE